MSWKAGTDSQNVLDLAGKLRNFICGYRELSGLTFTGTGSGTLDAFGATDAVAAQTFTITCTNATTTGSESWSVSGSVSGSLAVAVSNTLYESNGVTFIISSDTTADFAVNDEFQITVGASGAMQTAGDAATLQQHNYTHNGTAASEYKFQVEFSGAGSDTVNICHIAHRDIDNNRFMIRLYGAPTFNNLLDVDAQPGASPMVCVYTRNQPMNYWITANARGYTAVVQAGTTFRIAYCRYLTPYSSPASYPFPLAIGGDSADDTYVYSDQNSKIRFCADPAYNALQVMLPGGSWQGFGNYTSSENTVFAHSTQDFSAGNLTFPYGGTSPRYDALAALRPNIEGEYVMVPISVSVQANYEDVGEFEGLFFVPGYNTLAAGDIVQHLGVDHLVVQNIHRNTDVDHVALRLE